jgi:hypothetical protein
MRASSVQSIFMANLTSGLLGFIISTGLIVIVGEIVPQASLRFHSSAAFHCALHPPEPLGLPALGCAVDSAAACAAPRAA